MGFRSFAICREKEIAFSKRIFEPLSVDLKASDGRACACLKALRCLVHPAFKLERLKADKMI
jgi:hypothetical protein